MSEVKVNKISPRSGTAITLGDSGDTFTIPSGATLAIAGSVTGFTSAGIDDNATSVAITIDSSENVGIGTTSPTGILECKSLGNTQVYITAGNSSASELFFGDEADVDVGKVTYLHSSNAMKFQTNTSEAMRIDSSGNVGIGTTTPAGKLDVVGAIIGTELQIDGDAVIQKSSGDVSLTIAANENGSNREPSLNLKGANSSSNPIIQYGDSTSYTGSIQYENADNSMQFGTNSSEKMRITSAGLVGIGTTAPDGTLHVQNGSAGSVTAYSGSNLTLEASGSNNFLSFLSPANQNQGILFGDADANFRGQVQYSHTNDYMGFFTAASERMRINSSGNLLVGTTSTTPATGTSSGNLISAIGRNQFSSDSDTLELNRHGSDGIILSLRKDGTRVGSVGAEGGDLIVGTNDTGVQYCDSLDSIRPWNTSTNSGRDGSIDLGTGNVRYNTIYAVGGSINTSDENEKQSIQSLTTTEMNVGKKLSSLIKTYKWNSAVEEKGDNARTHTGLIAQQVKQAFTDEGLDASKYALWCSDTWYENADGKEVTEDTEGAISKTRFGLRYSELLSFIQAYNDQKFTELEARITTLEANNP